MIKVDETTMDKEFVEIFSIMLKEQDRLNSAIDSEWRNKNLPWYRYIYVEAAEAMGSLPFKHWKHIEPDLENLKVEYVDIMHFVLSGMLDISGFNPALFLSGENIFQCPNSNEVQMELIDEITRIASDSKRSGYEDIFCVLMDAWYTLGFDIKDMLREYMVKNCLNYFRTENGYKDGTYVKNWDGEEDNVVAYRLASTLKITDNFSDDLKGLLKDYYVNITQS